MPLRVDTPAEWVPYVLSPPTFGEARFTDWSAFRSPGAEATMASGCVATRIPGWVEDMRPPVEAKAIALLGAVASKMLSVPVDVRAKGGTFQLRSLFDVGGEPIGTGRTLLGFDDTHVLTCFAVCIANRATGTERACDASVARVELASNHAPPPPGIALGAATWAVHHPQPTVWAATGLLLLGCVLAVSLRTRPRSTIH